MCRLKSRLLLLPAEVEKSSCTTKMMNMFSSVWPKVANVDQYEANDIKKLFHVKIQIGASNFDFQEPCVDSITRILLVDLVSLLVFVLCTSKVEIPCPRGLYPRVPQTLLPFQSKHLNRSPL